MRWASKQDLKLDDSRSFATSAEMASFKQLREDGALSFFRSGVCAKCGIEIPKSKTHCSEACFAPEPEAM